VRRGERKWEDEKVREGEITWERVRESERSEEKKLVRWYWRMVGNTEERWGVRDHGWIIMTRTRQARVRIDYSNDGERRCPTEKERRVGGEGWRGEGVEKLGRGEGWRRLGEELWAKKGGMKKKGRRHKSREAGESVETLGEAMGRRGI
jgi:hypothetical protein